MTRKVISTKVRHGRPFYSVQAGRRVRFRYTTQLIEVTTRKWVSPTDGPKS